MHPKMDHPSGSMVKWHRHRGANWMMPHNNEIYDFLEVPPQLAEAEVHTDHEIQANSSAHPPAPWNRKPSPCECRNFLAVAEGSLFPLHLQKAFCTPNSQHKS